MRNQTKQKWNADINDWTDLKENARLSGIIDDWYNRRNKSTTLKKFPIVTFVIESFLCRIFWATFY